MNCIKSITSVAGIFLMALTFSGITTVGATSAPDELSSSVSDTCYYFVETNLDRGEFWNNRPSLSFLISNVVPASCNSGGGTRTDILNQFNEAVKADGRYADAKLARIVFGPYSSRQDGHREHRRHIGNYLENNHVVTDFSFRYYGRK